MGTTIRPEISKKNRYWIDKHGGVIIQNGKVDECNAKIKELEEMPVEDNGDIKFALDELAPINFSINEMLSLECYIEQ